jgi:hypothetical protein
LKFHLEKSYEILDRTPDSLKTILGNISPEWIMNNEGPDTFSPFDVLGHLIHGEKTDWRNRVEHILEFGVSKSFEPYDRFAMYELSKGRSIEELLDEFSLLRKQNMDWMRKLNPGETDLDKKGMHPVLGEVSMRELLSSWVIHDLTHIAQITRVMAKQYKEEMGPWRQFFRIIDF